MLNPRKINPARRTKFLPIRMKLRVLSLQARHLCPARRFGEVDVGFGKDAIYIYIRPMVKHTNQKKSVQTKRKRSEQPKTKKARTTKIKEPKHCKKKFFVKKWLYATRQVQKQQN